jgi:glycosyltransferase involved in cell wall biosynthesis
VSSRKLQSLTRHSRGRIGYVPHSSDLSHPGDYRRFPAYARARGIPFEIAQPNESYEVVVLSEVADIVTWAGYRRGKVVYDFIDSYLALPRGDFEQLLRGAAWFVKGRHKYPVLNFPAALERMCRRADAVVCTTDEQRQTIESLCSNVHIVLDIHDEILRSTKSNYGAGSPFRVVWEGLPSNIYQLQVIGAALHDIASRYQIELVVVTDPDQIKTIPWFGRVKTLDVVQRIFSNVTFHAWDKATWSDIVTQCDLAVIPINLKQPLCVGKPGNKLALFWRVGMPVLTSATPAYVRMQQAAGLRKFSCVNLQDWVTALKLMIQSEEERREAGMNGRDYVNRTLGTEALLQMWDQVLLSVGVEL